MNRVPIARDSICHVYNRGVEKRNIVGDEWDSKRFVQSMEIFNTVEPIVSIFSQSFKADELLSGPTTKNRLVDILCYCLNPNHYHIVLKQISEGGVSEFMKRLNGGYTRYFNHKHERTGALFEGKFKSKIIEELSYFLRVSAYVNLNNDVHELLSGPTTKLVRSSWGEYTLEHYTKKPLCNTKMILTEFGGDKMQYKIFAKNQLSDIKMRKRMLASIEF